ncbi:hypothetical protein D3C81_2253900 [compost metagenome]
MGKGEVFGGKATGFQQRDCQGIAHDQGGGGRRGGGQVQRTGFVLDVNIQVDLGGLG